MAKVDMASGEVAAGEAGRDFIRDIVKADLDAGRVGEVVTRFPPEPNGYLHIGHAKSICLNFGIAEEFGGRCHLRFDDTNPVKEEQEYIDAIERDVRWLGFDWGRHLYHASDYFEQLYVWAEDLIRAGRAYVDDQSSTEIRENRGTLTEPGRNSPFRERGVEENLDLFRRMRAGEFENGARVLRAKIDMASGNINLRDPVLYRILHAPHPRTGTTWKIYPSYDFAHGQSDAIECITHSICTLEFEDHRPLYDWLIEHLPVPSRPRQYEFARLNLTYTVLSKRVLTLLVRDGHVSGWDDPRMPTLAGLRRRGVPPQAIRDFVKRIGVAKANSLVDVGMFEFSIREALNRSALRRMAVLRPLKVVIENYPQGQVEELDAANHPDDAAAGSRKLKFARELYIEREDFMENPPKKFFRLSPGAEVRLRYAYFITCREVVKNAASEVIELRCTYDPATKGGNAPDGRKVKATIHWVSAAHSIGAEVCLYNPLFLKPDPSGGEGFSADLNPNSLEVLSEARLEPALGDAAFEVPVQFERQGYFCLDRDSTPARPVFNRTIGLRDTFARDMEVRTKSNLVADVIARIQAWAKKLAAGIGSGGIYLFGSLVHRAGTQFGAASDVDLVVVFPDDADNTKKRVAWLEKLLAQKQSLEAELAKALGRKPDKAICSVVAVTSDEIGANLHKDGAGDFFSENQFFDLLKGVEQKGLPGAGAKPIEDRLAIEVLRFVQKKRNIYLAVRPNGIRGLQPFTDKEPLPKDIARAGAMVAQLWEPAEEAGAEYDTQRGLDFFFNTFYEIQKRNRDYGELYNALSVRRGARGEVPDLSAEEQLLIAETIASLVFQHLAELARRKAEQVPRLREHSTVFFGKRIAQAFPGVRGIQWIEDKDAIKTRLEKLLANPIKFADASPIWWWRGHSCLPIEKFEYEKEGVFLMDGEELLISRIAAVVPGPYNRSFVYVEVVPMEPTGLYPRAADHIAEVKAGKSVFPYHSEEYGLVDGKHLVTRSELDDGAAVIGGHLEDIRGRNELRIRYLTPFNFVIAPQGNPIDNPAMDDVVEQAMNAMLRGEDSLPKLMEIVRRASLGRRYGE